MTPFGDLPGDMTETPGPDDAELDDVAFETWLRGGTVSAGLEPVAAVLAALASSADQFRPAPTEALARFLETGSAEPGVAGAPTTVRLSPESGPVDLAERRSRPGRRAGTATALAVALALTSVGAAAAAGTLPEPAQRAISRVVRGLTPFSLPSGSMPGPSRPAIQPVIPAVGSGAASQAQSPPSRGIGEKAQDETAQGTTGSHVVGPDPGDTEGDSPSRRSSQDDGARPETSAPAETAPGSVGSDAHGAPRNDTPDPADSPATTTSAVRSDSAPNVSPSVEQAAASPETSGAPDSADPGPGN